MARVHGEVKSLNSPQLGELGKVEVTSQKVGGRKVLTIETEQPRKVLQGIGFAFFQGKSLDLESTEKDDLVLHTHLVTGVELSPINTPLLVPLQVRAGDRLRIVSSRPGREGKTPRAYFSHVIRTSGDFRLS